MSPIEAIAAVFSVKSASSKVAAAISIISGTALFAPQEILGKLGVTEYVEEYRAIFGIAFLASSSFVAVSLLWIVGENAKNAFEKRKYRKTTIHYLRLLTSDEKAVMRRCIEEDTSTIQLPYNGGIANALEAKHLIFRSSNMGSFGTEFPYSIQPVVLDVLRKKPSLLD